MEKCIKPNAFGNALGSSLASASTRVERSTYQHQEMVPIGADELKWGGSTISDLDIGLPDASLADGSVIGRSGRVLRPSIQITQGDTILGADVTTFARGTPREEIDPNRFAKTAEGGKLMRTGVAYTRGVPIASPYYVKGAPVLEDGTRARAAYTMFGERVLAYRINGEDQFANMPGVEIDSRASYELDLTLRNIPVGAKNAVYGLGNLGLNLLDQSRRSLYMSRTLGSDEGFVPWGTPMGPVTFTGVLDGLYQVNPAGIAVNLGTGHPDLAGQGIGSGLVTAPIGLGFAGFSKVQMFATPSVLAETTAWRVGTSELNAVPNFAQTSYASSGTVVYTYANGDAIASGTPNLVRTGTGGVEVGANTTANISSSSLGKFLGEGGNKYVYAYGDNQAVAVLQAGKNPQLITDELGMLNRLNDLGIPTVNARGVTVSGQPGMLMDRFAQGSKDIVALQNGKVRIVGDSPLLNAQSISDLQNIRDTMVNNNIQINDLQFLISNEGRVVVADPLAVNLNKVPSKNNLRMIDLLIQSAKKNGPF